MFPATRQALNNPVTLEYTSRGKRVRREFPNSREARQAYLRLTREGRHPLTVARSSSSSPQGVVPS